MKNGKLVELPFLTYEDVQEYIETNISPYNANKPFNEQISTRIIFPPEEYGAESEIDRYNKHMDEILEVKARLLEENIGDYDPNDPEQEAENDAIYEVFSKYYPDIYGAEKTVPLNYTPDIAPYAGVFDKMEVTFKIQDADYATFYYTTDVPSGLRRHSNEHIVSYVWGDECELQDDDWFYCPYDWNGVGEHYLAKVMNKTLKAESFGAENDETIYILKQMDEDKEKGYLVGNEHYIREALDESFYYSMDAWYDDEEKHEKLLEAYETMSIEKICETLGIPLVFSRKGGFYFTSIQGDANIHVPDYVENRAESFGAEFIEWFEEAEGPDCFICGTPNPKGYFEGVDNICEPCESKWIYDEGGPEGEGYYLISTLNEEQRGFFKMDAESFVLKTDSGHEVEWDDGSFYMAFKEPIDGYGVVSGDWYGGEKESPDEISLDVEPAWDEENEDDYDVPPLYIQFDNVEYYGIRNHNMTVSDDRVLSPELSGAIQEGVALMVDDHADKTVVSREYKGESFGAEYGKRQRFGNRYIARDTKGRIISNVSVGRSLKADRRNKSKTPARSGFGHKGDSQKGASGEFKLPTDAKSVIGIGAVLGGLLAYLESKA